MRRIRSFLIVLALTLVPCSLAIAQLSYKQISVSAVASSPGAAVSAALTASDAAGGVFVTMPAVSSGGTCAIVILGRDYQGFVYATRVTVTCTPIAAAKSGTMTIDGIGSGELDYSMNEGTNGGMLDLAFNSDEMLTVATPSPTATATPTATPT
ncbi:MAG: hypothetical protein WBQ86_09695 [Candidatus Binatus sp.]